MASSRRRQKKQSITVPHHHHIAVGFSAIAAGAICLALGTALFIFPGGQADKLFTPAAAAYPRSAATALTWKWVTPQDGLVAYDIRYSVDPITVTNFSAATRVSNPPKPQSAGQVQAINIFGLQPDTVYYFAMKAKDAAGNWSAISNVSTKVTSPLAQACRPTYLCSDWLPCRDHHRVRTCSNRNGCNSDLGQPITDQYCTSAKGDQVVTISQNLVAIGQGPQASPIVRIYNPEDWRMTKQLTIWPAHKKAGMHLASGDINGDHQAELVVASTRLMSPQLRAYSSQGVLITAVDPYPAVRNSGVSVAVGDIDGNGVAEIGVGPDSGAGALRLYAHDPVTKQLKLIAQTLPYGPAHTQGFRVAMGDIDNDGRAEIILTRHNTTTVEVYKYTNGTVVPEYQWSAYPDGWRSDMIVTVGDINGDGEQEIITANGAGNWTKIRIFNQRGRLVTSLTPYNRSNFSGVSMTTLDINQDGQDEILTVPTGRTQAQLRGWRFDTVTGGWKLIKQFMALPSWPAVGASLTAS